MNMVMELKDYQLNILSLIAEGYSSEEISRKIHLSKRTVEGIRLKLIRAFDVKNTPSLIYHALKKGVI